MSEPNIETKDALIVVDVQNDFCPGGALPIPEGDQVISALNEWLERVKRVKALVFASRDWHPPRHVSFKEQGGPWPPHCVRNTDGAEVHSGLKLPPGAIILDKGTAPNEDHDSAFESTDIAERLREAEVKRVFVGGLALDVGVRATALKSIEAGFETHLIADATRATDPQEGQKALEEIRSAGAVIEEPEAAA